MLHSLEERLEAVLTAAIKAPGNKERLHQAGLITRQHADGREGLVADWPSRFQQIPLLSKDMVRRQPGQFLARADDVVYRGATSGSRSRPYLFFAGKAWNQQRITSRRRALEWWGISDDIPIINVASRLMPGRPGDSAIAGMLDQELLDMFLMCLGDRTSAVRGYPSRLCEVASHLRQPLPSIKAVICTGEPLVEHQQRLLEERFQAPVINEYGCHEAAAFGITCPEVGRLHLDESRCLYEVVKGALVTTDLWNETMPLIRYQCGDRVRMYSTPCACGRPGPTVEILGRVEDWVSTSQGNQPTAAVAMPCLPGVLHYRVKRLAREQLVVSARVDHEVPASAELSLQMWIQKTFGNVNAQVSLEPPRIRPSSIDVMLPDAELWNDAQWIEMITQKSIGTWLSSPQMPMGEAKEAAKLLKALLSPRIIGVGLPIGIQQQIMQLAQSLRSRDERVEAIKGRILLLACSCLTKPMDALELYDQAKVRLQNLSQKYEPNIALDLLISSLHLPPAVTQAAWQELATDLSPTLDTLNIYHLLSAFEAVIHRRSASDRPIVARKLKPILAVLMGDLSFWAAAFEMAHLAHWYELLQGFSAPYQPTPTLSQSSFLFHWLQWRQGCLLDPQNSDDAFKDLQTAAKTPVEITRLQIERGYRLILCNQPLDPSEWLSIIETHAEGHSPKANQQTADLTPWMPIVQALVQPLQQSGQGDLAYRCLVAASLSSRQQSAFERLTVQFNGKQPVLVDEN